VRYGNYMTVYCGDGLSVDCVQLEGLWTQSNSRVETISQSINSIKAEMEKLEVLAQSQPASQPMPMAPSMSMSSSMQQRGRFSR
jgi:hypothetical protein